MLVFDGLSVFSSIMNAVLIYQRRQ